MSVDFETISIVALKYGTAFRRFDRIGGTTAVCCLVLNCAAALIYTALQLALNCLALKCFALKLHQANKLE